MSRPVIAGIYVVTDPSAPIPQREQARLAVASGVRWVQLRDKTATDARIAEEAEHLAAVLAPDDGRLIVNDRLAAAQAPGVAGLHMGKSDGDPRERRRVLGPDAVLGLSIETLAQLNHVPWDAVDYLGVGPVRATATKPDHALPIGFDGLAAICAAARCPCVAIGGLGSGDMTIVRDAGAVGAAVVSAVSRAADPERAVLDLIEEWESA